MLNCDRPATSRFIWSWAAQLCICAVAATTAAVAGAAASAAMGNQVVDGELPPADTILARYVEALGGAEAIRKHDSLRIEGRVELPHLELEGTIVSLVAAPNKFHTAYSVPGLGDRKDGYDGRIGWRMEQGIYPRLVQGRELQDMLLTNAFYPELDYPELYSTRETLARTEFAGEDAYKVRLVTDWGEEVTHYYSVESGLLVGRDTWSGPPDDGFDVVEEFGDYEEVAGRLLAKRVRQKFAGIEQIVIMTKVEYGAVEADELRPPPEVLELVAEGSR